jgi:hypothetical protein
MLTRTRRDAASSSVLLGLVLLCGTRVAHAQQPAVATLPATGTLHGEVQDADGEDIPAAKVTLQGLGLPDRVLVSDEDGEFTFVEVPPGAYVLQVVAKGFSPATVSGLLAAAEKQEVPPVRLKVAEEDIAVDAISQKEMAEQQIHQEEQQRLFGVLPNYFVAYDRNAVPLTAGQKFELSWKTSIDLSNFAVSAGIAGVFQARNEFPTWGQGAAGYAKRFSSTYGNFFFGTMLGGWAMPALLHQDPRYFYKGSGTTWQRIRYALEMSVVARGDNGRWQPAYASILGELEAGALANAYYPALERDSATLTFENTGLGIVGNAVGNIVQEFLLKHVTTKTPNLTPAP